MKLDSARNLKSDLISKLLRGDIFPAAAIRSVSVAAMSLAAAPRRQATIAIGISRASKSAYRVAVRLQQRSLEADQVVESIRKQAKGEADIRYIGRVHPMTATPWHKKRQRPLLIGCSIGHFNITAGTLGCFVRANSGSSTDLMVLSNNHVLADENAAKKGDAIIQPGDADAGKPSTDTVATLTRFVKIKSPGVNHVDAAVATLKSGIHSDLTQLKGLGTLASTDPVDLDIDDVVHKVGRTTGVTRGKVSAIEVDNVFVDYDFGRASFDNQIEIEGTATHPFSQGGDSGSLIVTSDFKPAALLFAGSDHGGPHGFGHTYANPIAAVLKALKVKIAV